MVTSQCGNLNVYKKASTSKWQRKFRIWLPTVSIPLKSTIHQMVNKFQAQTQNMFFTRNIALHWTAIQSTSMQVFKTHETILSKYVHRIPHTMSLQTKQISSCARNPETGHKIRVQFCNWFCFAACRVEVSPSLTYSTDVIWF